MSVGKPRGISLLAEPTPQILGKWKDFEEYIQRQDKNANYFNPVHQLTDFDSYYKGPALKIDIENYFSDITL